VRLLLGVLVVAGLALVTTQPASAGRCHGTDSASAGTTVGNGAFMVTGESYESEDCGATAIESGSGAHLQVTEPACGLGGQVACQETIPCDGTGVVYNAEWVYPDGHTESGPQQCVGGQQSPPAPQVTGVRVLEAFKTIPLPTPTLGMSPPDGVTLVNLPTIFYTRAEPFARDVRVLGRQVHLEIAPVSYSWSVGQGGEFATTWPGSPYQRGVTPQEDPDAYVTWAYDDAGATEAARVRVVWGATWSLDGKSMGRVPGTVEMISPAATVTVKEARPVLTGS
jgi:hypothetical protein